MTHATAPFSQATRGMMLGFVGVAAFSLTLPFTRYLVQFVDPFLVSWARSVLAGFVALVVLVLSSQRRPNRQELAGLVLAIIGIVLGWPTLSSISMKYAPAAHGAVINGLLPIATATIGALLARQRLTLAFWAFALLGAGLVFAFMLWEGAGSLQPGDAVMLCAVVMGGLGYASGAGVAKTLGGWQTICWALVLALPLTSILTLGAFWANPVSVASLPSTAWLAFAYLGLISQLAGFFAWYAGLAMGGVALVSQVQLLQMLMTVAASSLIALDPVPGRTWVFAAAIMLVLVGLRRVKIVR